MRSRRPSLKLIVFVGMAALMLLPALTAGLMYAGQLERRSKELIAESLAMRGEVSASQLGRRLNQLWLEVERLATMVDTDDLATARGHIDFIAQLDRRYTWIGVADPGGRVLAATQRMLEGETVAQRPWFRNGLIGPTAIDVHEAKLLANLLPRSVEPLRFIDLAAPIRQGSQAARGVVGAHFDWKWVQDNMSGLQAPGIDLILVSRDREVLYGPGELIGKQIPVAAAEAAARTSTAVIDERWPDGKVYISAVIPTIGYADLPSFGWSLIVRKEYDAAVAPTRELIRSFWMMVTSGAAVSLVFAFMLASWITTPLRRIAGSLQAMLSGAKSEKPYSETRYAEAEAISTALVQIQANSAGFARKAPAAAE